MEFVETDLPGVVRITPQVFADERGFFMETWQEQHFAAAGIDATFVQDNVSQSTRGTLRGLHYQLEQPQGKLVRVAVGEVFDVAIDVRRSSENFGRWTGERLSADNKHSLWIPPGFAHGFLVLSDIAIFEYKCTAFYSPDDERSIRWNDTDLDIDWPLSSGDAPVLSARDSAAASFADAETYA